MKWTEGFCFVNKNRAKHNWMVAFVCFNKEILAGDRCNEEGTKVECIGSTFTTQNGSLVENLIRSASCWSVVKIHTVALEQLLLVSHTPVMLMSPCTLT